MGRQPRKIAFIVAASERGTFILNRLDYNSSSAGRYGVGIQMLDTGLFDDAEVELGSQLLELRKKYFGDGAVAIDCGANIGVHSVTWAKSMTGWGTVTAIEAQERIYYALAGNIAINNCFNANAIYAAVSDSSGTMRIPVLNYENTASFGSLELMQLDRAEDIGQPVDYSEEATVEIKTMTIDGLKLQRCDLIKIDVEGMETRVLDGATVTIDRSLPIILVEIIKTDRTALQSRLTKLGYQIFEVGINYLAIHRSDPCLLHLTQAASKN